MAQIARKTGLMSLFYIAGAIGFLGFIVSRLGLVDRMPKEKAKTMLKRVPGAFREAAVSGTEEYARANSHEKVTAGVMTQFRKELGM